MAALHPGSSRLGFGNIWIIIRRLNVEFLSKFIVILIEVTTLVWVYIVSVALLYAGYQRLLADDYEYRESDLQA